MRVERQSTRDRRPPAGVDVASAPARARVAVCGVVAVLCLAVSLTAPALGAYPERPVTLIVPFPPNGATDLAGRTLAKGLGQRLGQPVVVENKAGAGTAIAAESLARSAPDGYTLMLSTTSTFTINPAISAGLHYDPKQFEAIGIVGGTSLVLLAHPTLPASTVEELVALARRRPGALAYASYGTGTSAHFAGEMLARTIGVELLHVPYRGSAPAMQDLIGGQVQLAVDTVVAARPQVAAGRIKPIAVLSLRRSPALPDVPTVAESGYPGFAFEPWAAVVAPRGLPPSVRRQLVKELADTLADPKVHDLLSKAGIDVAYEPPGAYDERLATELPLMREVARRAGIARD